MWNAYVQRGGNPPALVYVRAGTLDDPEVARPAVTIWTSAAPTWACIDSDVPRRWNASLRRPPDSR